MTITRREKSVPTSLPAAKLYLDDVEEVVRILTEAGNRLEVQPGRRGTEITFEVDDRLCDDIQDLPKIAKRTHDFELRLTNEQCGYSARLGITWVGCQWTTIGLTKEVAWSAFRKLEAVFNSRKLHRLSVGRTPEIVLEAVLTGLLTGLLTTLIVGSAVRLLKTTYRLNAYEMGGLTFLLSLVTLAIVITTCVGGSGVIFRYSWDQDARRRENAWRVIPTILTGIFALIVGIIIEYLRHRFWP